MFTITIGPSTVHTSVSHFPTRSGSAHSPSQAASSSRSLALRFGGVCRASASALPAAPLGSSNRVKGGESPTGLSPKDRLPLSEGPFSRRFRDVPGREFRRVGRRIALPGLPLLWSCTNAFVWRRTASMLLVISSRISCRLVLMVATSIASCSCGVLWAMLAASSFTSV